MFGMWSSSNLQRKYQNSSLPKIIINCWLPPDMWHPVTRDISNHMAATVVEHFENSREFLRQFLVSDLYLSQRKSTPLSIIQLWTLPLWHERVSYRGSVSGILSQNVRVASIHFKNEQLMSQMKANQACKVSGRLRKVSEIYFIPLTARQKDTDGVLEKVR